ncbi:MAG: hypothetical protein M3O61_15015 [Gemmatimonadota bacterium]|nr:hypothetical protein [Gemmatimonadota bacterium]
MLDKRLLGRWRSVAGVGPELVTIDFEGDGSLTYTIHGPSSDQKMLLRYTVEDGVIITDQPSAPREERTAYRITTDGQLVMLYSGEQSVFIRDAG